MSFLDKPVSELTSAELQRLISNEVARQVPAIPTGVLGLSDLEKPVTVTTLGTQGQVPTFHAPGTNFVFSSPGSLSDGSPPNLSPDLSAATSFVQGGIGLINASWSSTGVSSGDPVAYDVHISSVSNTFTPTALTLYATTEATSISIKSQANGSSLLYNIPYYIRLVAFDNDGAAAAGVSVVAGTKISADIGTITAGTLIGATVETAASGKRVVMDATGLVLYNASDGPVVTLPTDPDAPATFAGTLQAATLQSAAAVLNGSTQVGSGGAMSLAAGVVTPITAPGVATLAGGSLSATTSYWVSFSWYDGSHETTVYTPVVKITTTSANKSLTITLPAAPSGASQARIYMDTASFGVGFGKLQSSPAVSTTATTTTTITSFNAAGAASPATSSTAFTSVTATVRPGSATDSTGAAYGWTLEGNGRARFVGPTINSQFWMYDDFYYATSVYTAVNATPFGMYWTNRFGVGGGAGAGTSAGSSSTTNPGIMQHTTGTGATATAGAQGSGNGTFFTGTAKLRFSVLFWVDTIPTNLQKFQIIMGLTSQAAVATGALVSSAADKAINFQLDTDAAGAKLSLVSANASSMTTAFGPVLDTGAHFVEFEVDAGRAAINWWIDATKQTAITTNIPTNVQGMGLYLGIQKTLGATARTLNIDSVALYGDYVSG